MRILKDVILGSSLIGLHAWVSEAEGWLPIQLPAVPPRWEDALGAKLKLINVYDSPLVGIFVAGNSNGILVPYLVDRKKVPRATMVKDKLTALGNLVLANDRGALIAPSFSGATERTIRETLGVETVRTTIAGLETVGSCGLATNHGCLVHPEVTEKEMETIESVLKARVHVGTLNRGNPYVGSSAIATTKAAIIGPETTPVELTRLEEALG